MTSPNWPVDIRSRIPGYVWWGEVIGGKIKWFATTGYNVIKNIDAKYIGWERQMANPPTISQNRYTWTANSKNEYYAWDGQTFGEIDAAMTAGGFSKHSLISSMFNDILAGKISPQVYATIIWLAFYAPKTLLALDSIQTIKPLDLIVPSKPIVFQYEDAALIPKDQDKSLIISWMEDQPFPANLPGASFPGAGTVGTTGARSGGPADNSPSAPLGQNENVDFTGNGYDGGITKSGGMTDTTKYVLIAGGVALTGTVLYFLLRKK